MGPTLKYRVLPSLAVDTNEGAVWIRGGDFRSRVTAKVERADRNGRDYVELRIIDNNFMDYYNKEAYSQIDISSPTVVMSAWYQSKLSEHPTREDVDLSITLANDSVGQFLACVAHPQTVVRMAVWLGLIGVILGAVGAVAGLMKDLTL